MLLRALENLSIGNTKIKRGTIFKAARLRPEIQDILIVRQKVAPVSAPPIAAMSDFKEVAETLARCGIETVADVVEADAVEGLSPEDLAALKSKAEATLTISKRCNCHRE